MTEFLIIAGFCQALLLGVFFLGKRARPGNLHLAFLMTSLALLLGLAALGRPGFAPALSLLPGILYFLAIRAQVGIYFAHRFMAGTLFVPPLVEFAYLLFLSLEGTTPTPAAVTGLCVVNSAYTLSLMFFSMRIALRGSRESEPARRVHWRAHLVFASIWLVLMALDLALIILLPGSTFNQWVTMAVALLILLFGFVQVYGSRRRGDALFELPGIKYSKTQMSEDAARRIAEDLLAYLDEEEPFRRPEFRIQDAAKRLGHSGNTVSQAVNRRFGQTFPELVTSYRLREARRRLSHGDYADHSILRIAFDSGFNSKSAFNRLFRESMGVTPSRYRESQSRSQSQSRA